jgi:hypothetical protein
MNNKKFIETKEKNWKVKKGFLKENKFINW